MADSPESKILVVEDADCIRKMVCSMLAQAGYECLEAADGVEALGIIGGSQDLKLVLTDMVMPRMGGAELARQLSRARPDIRILFMSGFTDDPIVRSMGQHPAIFLPKPFTSTALTDKVREALERPWDGLPAVSAGNGR